MKAEEVNNLDELRIRELGRPQVKQVFRECRNAWRKRQLLSPREREVLNLLTEGKRTKEIAQNLQISPRTVEIHRTNMRIKLEAKTVAATIEVGVLAKLHDHLMMSRL